LLIDSGEPDQVGVIIFAFLERRERRPVDLDQRAPQRLGRRAIADAFEPRDGRLAAVPNRKEAPFDASNVQGLMARQAVHAVAEQLEPEFALDAVRPGNRSESDWL
jgi:hypothetical protein